MHTSPKQRTLLGVILFVPLAALLLVMFACLPAPVGDPATSKVDPALAGAWTATDDEGKGLLVLVRPWDTHTYYVEYMWQSKKEGKEDNGVIHLKAWLTTLGGSTFMTFEPLDRLDYVSKDEGSKAWWLVMRLDVQPDAIKVRPINQDSPLVKDLDTREKLEQAIAKNASNDELYGKELTFQKIAASGKATDAEMQLIKEALEVFHVAK
ncbi:MAG TPA: hypothetical protein VM008_07470 [Phycisphaerae bacterium]|nr:hypothetical protein [Phycisphaerae bacterium]